MEACAQRVAEEEVTQTTTVTEVPEQPLVLHLHKPDTGKKVKWDEKVVDNEFLGKKSSKCCCIYTPPVAFGESSSEDDNSDDCCHEFKSSRGKKKKKQQKQE